jgi:hypothetical protein
MYKLPTDIIYKIQEFEPLANVYAEIEESKRSTWLKQKIRERSYIPDDQLVYEIQESNLSAYYVIPYSLYCYSYKMEIPLLIYV